MLGNLKVLLGQTVSVAGIQMDQIACRQELLPMAFMVSLQATLWCSVIIPEMIVCRHPERIWRALSAC